ncbi:MAG TPA: hypothetical protein VMV71_02355 [Candidatus Paceibacterota bacterium]|nr:hypothetical protein [Candidatus Paceibacterota bacterium]
MIKNILTIIFALAFAFPAAAQVTPATGTSSREGVRQEIQNIRAQANQQVQGIRQTMREQIQAERESFQKEVEAKRAEVQSAAQARVAKLKADLQNIKDNAKKAAVERIDQNIADLNTRITTHYANVLDQIAEILGRIVSRTDTAQANGKDVIAARSAITNAQNTIAAARTAVSAQTGKIYSLGITTSTASTALKGVVGITRQALQKDLKNAEDSVKAARDAVRQAAVALAQIPGVDELKPSTSTAATSTANQ